LVNANH
jgi:20S proteasome subunit alpha 5